jgi:hypothetical protein
MACSCFGVNLLTLADIFAIRLRLIASPSPLQIYFRKACTFKRFGVMDGHGRAERGQRRFKMKTFTIDAENNISVFASPEEAAAASTTPFDTFTSQEELAELAKAWPAERLVATWNSLTGVTPVESFKNSKAAASRIWKQIQSLGDAAQPEPEATKPEVAPAKQKAGKKAKAGAQAAKGAPVKGKSSKKATPAKAVPKGKKAAKAPEASAPREGSKMSQVIAMLQRKNGATITEIMEAMGWLRHTVRGFMAGAMKKAGYQVESFKPEGGERSYRLCGAPHKR